MPPGPEAWHEAGHALAAHLVGGIVRVVTLESELDGHEGHVAVEWRAMPEDDAARCSAIVALAGPVAELVFQGEDLLYDEAALSTWAEDWREADGQLARLHPEQHERETARRTIFRQLRDRFDSIEGFECLARLADALDAHETLDEGLFLDALGDVWREARSHPL